MPIKNYTSKVPAHRSIKEIQDALVSHGATGVLYEMDKVTVKSRCSHKKVHTEMISGAENIEHCFSKEGRPLGYTYNPTHYIVSYCANCGARLKARVVTGVFKTNE